MESSESMESMDCQAAIHPISQPASIFGPEQKALWGQVSVSGSVRAKKEASISTLKGRFFGGEVLGLVLIHGSHGMKPWKVFIHKIDS